jgi:peptidylprolyl isomerase/peptidyl-prolyl cis-trans isomerase D
VTAPVKTRFGYHVIKVEGKANQAVKIADYALPIRTLVSTLTKIEDDLEDLAEFSKDDGFRAEAERRAYTVQTVQLEEDQENIPQLGNSRKLLDFLASAKVGAISEVIELNEQYLVATVTAITPAGVRPFDTVKAELEPRVKVEKRKAYQHTRLEEARAANADLASIAAAVGASVQSANDVAINNPLVPGLGREPALVGTALGLETGELSKVVDGGAASFVLVQKGLSTLAPISDTEKESIRTQMLQQRQSALRSQWIQDIREQADIVDNRRRLTQF